MATAFHRTPPVIWRRYPIIGGCSLEEHCRQLDGGEVSYEYQKDAECRRMISLPEAMAKQYALRVIPTGDAVQRARQLPEFNTETGGLSLTRDGYHLSLDYGRYLAALVWLHTLTGRKPKAVSFAPDAAKTEYLSLLKKAALPHS